MKTSHEMIDAAVAAATEIRDEPGQMHRRAAAGRRIVSHLHGWDRWGNNGAGGIKLSLRLEGQFIDLSVARFGLRSDAVAFQALVDEALAGVPAPIAAEA